MGRHRNSTRSPRTGGRIGSPIGRCCVGVDRADGAVACLSCVFDYEGAELAYRHAYALDTCRRAIPPERDLATVMPLG